MKRLERNNYLEKLMAFRDKHIIKIITGIRRCGKSTLMEIYQDALRSRGVAEEQIVAVNFEDFDFRALRQPEQLHAYACIIVDEAQFLTRAEVRYLTDLVDEQNIPVICYGLRTDFKGELFPGSQELMACADIIEEVKTICWCGKKATFNARFDAHGVVLKEGEQVVLGANDRYIGLCRKHWKEGNLGPQ